MNKDEAYKILGVSKDSDKAVCKKAFRRLARKKHPDFGGTAEEFTLLQSAMDCIEKGTFEKSVTHSKNLRHKDLFSFFTY